MSVKMRQVGNSHGFIIPSALLREVGFDPADEFDLTPVEGGILISRVTEEYEQAMAAYEDVVAGYRNTLRDLAR